MQCSSAQGIIHLFSQSSVVGRFYGRMSRYPDTVLHNTILKQVNQIGSVTESIEAVRMSKKAGWGVMASHQSRETEDIFIVNLSISLAMG